MSELAPWELDDVTSDFRSSSPHSDNPSENGVTYPDRSGSIDSPSCIIPSNPDVSDVRDDEDDEFGLRKGQKSNILADASLSTHSSISSKYPSDGHSSFAVSDDVCMTEKNSFMSQNSSFPFDESVSSVNRFFESGSEDGLSQKTSLQVDETHKELVEPKLSQMSPPMGVQSGIEASLFMNPVASVGSTISPPPVFFPSVSIPPPVSASKGTKSKTRSNRYAVQSNWNVESTTSLVGTPSIQSLPLLPRKEFNVTLPTPEGETACSDKQPDSASLNPIESGEELNTENIKRSLSGDESVSQLTDQTLSYPTVNALLDSLSTQLDEETGTFSSNNVITDLDNTLPANDSVVDTLNCENSAPLPDKELESKLTGVSLVEGTSEQDGDSTPSFIISPAAAVPEVFKSESEHILAATISSEVVDQFCPIPESLVAPSVTEEVVSTPLELELIAGDNENQGELTSSSQVPSTGNDEEADPFETPVEPKGVETAPHSSKPSKGKGIVSLESIFTPAPQAVPAQRFVSSSKAESVTASKFFGKYASQTSAALNTTSASTVPVVPAASAPSTAALFSKKADPLKAYGLSLKQNTGAENVSTQALSHSSARKEKKASDLFSKKSNNSPSVDEGVFLDSDAVPMPKKVVSASKGLELSSVFANSKVTTPNSLSQHSVEHKTAKSNGDLSSLFSRPITNNGIPLGAGPYFSPTPSSSMSGSSLGTAAEAFATPVVPEESMQSKFFASTPNPTPVVEQNVNIGQVPAQIPPVAYNNQGSLMNTPSNSSMQFQNSSDPQLNGPIGFDPSVFMPHIPVTLVQHQVSSAPPIIPTAVPTEKVTPPPQFHSANAVPTTLFENTTSFVPPAIPPASAAPIYVPTPSGNIKSPVVQQKLDNVGFDPSAAATQTFSNPAALATLKNTMATIGTLPAVPPPPAFPLPLKQQVLDQSVTTGRSPSSGNINGVTVTHGTSTSTDLPTVKIPTVSTVTPLHSHLLKRDLASIAVSGELIESKVVPPPLISPTLSKSISSPQPSLPFVASMQTQLGHPFNSNTPYYQVPGVSAETPTSISSSSTNLLSPGGFSIHSAAQQVAPPVVHPVTGFDPSNFSNSVNITVPSQHYNSFGPPSSFTSSSVMALSSAPTPVAMPTMPPVHRHASSAARLPSMESLVAAMQPQEQTSDAYGSVNTFENTQSNATPSTVTDMADRGSQAMFAAGMVATPFSHIPPSTGGLLAPPPLASSLPWASSTTQPPPVMPLPGASATISASEPSHLSVVENTEMPWANIASEEPYVDLLNAGPPPESGTVLPPSALPSVHALRKPGPSGTSASVSENLFADDVPFESVPKSAKGIIEAFKLPSDASTSSLTGVGDNSNSVQFSYERKNQGGSHHFGSNLPVLTRSTLQKLQPEPEVPERLSAAVEAFEKGLVGPRLFCVEEDATAIETLGKTVQTSVATRANSASSLYSEPKEKMKAEKSKPISSSLVNKPRTAGASFGFGGILTFFGGFTVEKRKNIIITKHTTLQPVSDDESSEEDEESSTEEEDSGEEVTDSDSEADSSEDTESDMSIDSQEKKSKSKQKKSSKEKQPKVKKLIPVPKLIQTEEEIEVIIPSKVHLVSTLSLHSQGQLYPLLRFPASSTDAHTLSDNARALRSLLPINPRKSVSGHSLGVQGTLMSSPLALSFVSGASLLTDVMALMAEYTTPLSDGSLKPSRAAVELLVSSQQLTVDPLDFVKKQGAFNGSHGLNVTYNAVVAPTAAAATLLTMLPAKHSLETSPFDITTIGKSLDREGLLQRLGVSVIGALPSAVCQAVSAVINTGTIDPSSSDFHDSTLLIAYGASPSVPSGSKKPPVSSPHKTKTIVFPETASPSSVSPRKSLVESIIFVVTHFKRALTDLQPFSPKLLPVLTPLAALEAVETAEMSQKPAAHLDSYFADFVALVILFGSLSLRLKVRDWLLSPAAAVNGLPTSRFILASILNRVCFWRTTSISGPMESLMTDAFLASLSPGSLLRAAFTAATGRILDLANNIGDLDLRLDSASVVKVFTEFARVSSSDTSFTPKPLGEPNNNTDQSEDKTSTVESIPKGDDKEKAPVVENIVNSEVAETDELERNNGSIIPPEEKDIVVDAVKVEKKDGEENTEEQPVVLKKRKEKKSAGKKTSSEVKEDLIVEENKPSSLAPPPLSSTMTTNSSKESKEKKSKKKKSVAPPPLLAPPIPSAPCPPLNALRDHVTFLRYWRALFYCALSYFDESITGDVHSGEMLCSSESGGTNTSDNADISKCRLNVYPSLLYPDVLVCLGDRLLRHAGDVQGAHALYVLAGVPLEEPVFEARLSLPGIDHRFLPRGLSLSLEGLCGVPLALRLGCLYDTLRRTIYEAAVTTWTSSRSSCSPKVAPTAVIFPLRLALAATLLDHGLPELAAAELQSVSRAECFISRANQLLADCNEDANSGKGVGEVTQAFPGLESLSPLLAHQMELMNDRLKSSGLVDRPVSLLLLQNSSEDVDHVVGGLSVKSIFSTASLLLPQLLAEYNAAAELARKRNLEILNIAPIVGLPHNFTSTNWNNSSVESVHLSQSATSEGMQMPAIETVDVPPFPGEVVPSSILKRPVSKTQVSNSSVPEENPWESASSFVPQPSLNMVEHNNSVKVVGGPPLSSPTFATTNGNSNSPVVAPPPPVEGPSSSKVPKKKNFLDDFDSVSAANPSLNTHSNDTPNVVNVPSSQTQSTSAESSTQNGGSGLFSSLKSLFGKPVKQVSFTSSSGGEPYYDEKRGRWIFPGEEDQGGPPPLAAPPTTAASQDLSQSQNMGGGLPGRGSGAGGAAGLETPTITSPALMKKKAKVSMRYADSGLASPTGFAPTPTSSIANAASIVSPVSVGRGFVPSASFSTPQSSDPNAGVTFPSYGNDLSSVFEAQAREAEAELRREEARLNEQPQVVVPNASDPSGPSEIPSDIKNVHSDYFEGMDPHISIQQKGPEKSWNLSTNFSSFGGAAVLPPSNDYDF